MFDHREEAGELLILAVGVDGGLFDQRLQRGWSKVLMAAP
jgi:hypothetical protein